MGLLSFLAPGLGGLIEGIAGNGDNSNDALIGDNGLISNPVGAWDKFKNGATNDVNYKIAQENLEYQRERNEIEDARYEDETAYNRAFAEDERNYQRQFAENERAYQRQLQQEIFNREDTAIERQASQLSALGINPLSQNMSGLSAGQALTPSTAGAAAEPSLSSRGGSALHNDFKMQDMGVLQAISPIMSLADSMNGVLTGVKQRDLLSAQRDSARLNNQAQAIDNLIKASENDITINDDGTVTLNREFGKKAQDFNEIKYADENASKNRNVREDIFQDTYGSHDNSSLADQIATDAAHQADRAYNTTTKQAIPLLVESAKAKFDDFTDSLSSGWENDKQRFKKYWNKVKNFFSGNNNKSSEWKRAQDR